MALGRRCRPRDRQAQRSTGTGGHVPQREAPARREDATRLGVEPALVRDVHLDVLADHDVERRIIEWQLGDIGGADLDLLAGPDGVVEPLGDVAVLGCDVDRGDAGAPLGSDESSGPADPGAGIEYTVACVDLRELDEGGGGEAAEAVKVLEHHELGRLERADVLAGRGQGTLDVCAGLAGGVGRFESGPHDWTPGGRPSPFVDTVHYSGHVWTLSTKLLDDAGSGGEAPWAARPRSRPISARARWARARAGGRP